MIPDMFCRDKLKEEDDDEDSLKDTFFSCSKYLYLNILLIQVRQRHHLNNGKTTFM